MNIVEIIRKKRDGEVLSQTEIETLIQRVTRQELPDYQLAAWLMAVYFKGMSLEETTHLTRAMAYSGDILDLSSVEGIKVDKHSTGGVGDKVTLVLAPLVASTGLIVAKLSGRGLGHTGGTIDKFEAIPGFRTSLSNQEFMQQLRSTQVAVAGQTQNLAPADKVLYALRDVTATVDSIPLIVGSILSKKIAAGADIIVLDVKYGSGAFMPDYDSAKTLASTMVQVGKSLGRSVSVLLSDMDQPLGRTIGHTLEIEESLEMLKGGGPEDLKEVVLTLGAMQLMNAERVASLEEGKTLLQHQIHSGKALLKFEALIKAQGGNPDIIHTPELMPHAPRQIEFKALQSGVIHHLKAEYIGRALKALGGGRDRKDDILDLGVGISLHKKRGDTVQAGEVCATLHLDQQGESEALAFLAQAYDIQDQPLTASTQLIREIIWA